MRNGPPPGTRATDGFNEDGTWFGDTDERLCVYLNICFNIRLYLGLLRVIRAAAAAVMGLEEKR